MQGSEQVGEAPPSEATEARGPRFRRFSRDVEAFNAVTNRRIYETEGEIQGYRGRTVLAPDEHLILERLRDRWHEIDVLDVGVGAGRTAYTFGAIAHRYVGIDYSAAMIELSREMIPESDRVQLMVADARDLSAFEDASFDFILFSHNGIDAVGPEERPVVLREFRRVLSADGVLLLSTHSLNALPIRAPRKFPSLRPPLGQMLRSTRTFLREAGDWVRYRRANGSLDLDKARARGWGVARDPGHNFALAHYYVTATAQIEQFREAGLEVTEVLDTQARPVDPATPGDDPSLSYICRPSG